MFRSEGDEKSYHCPVQAPNGPIDVVEYVLPTLGMGNRSGLAPPPLHVTGPASRRESPFSRMPKSRRLTCISPFLHRPAR